MESALERLVALVPPPGEPTLIDWDAAEREIWDGFRFPQDYRALVERYGPGTFAQAIRLNVPRAPVASWDVREESLLQADINRMRLAAPRVGPPWRYPLYPERGSLVAWADGADGFPLYWLPRGSPEAWPTVIENFEDLSMREYPMPCTEVLLALIEERLDIPAFTYIPSERRYVFEPLPSKYTNAVSSSPLLDSLLRPARIASRGVQSALRRSRDLLGGG